MYASLTKSKINTVSSTETKVFLVGEKLPKHLVWLRNFAVEQSDDPGQVRVLYQDNKSHILLLQQNNSRLSCRKGSKHIPIRYFFITDQILKKISGLSIAPQQLC